METTNFQRAKEIEVEIKNVETNIENLKKQMNIIEKNEKGPAQTCKISYYRSATDYVSFVLVESFLDFLTLQIKKNEMELERLKTEFKEL